MHSVPVRVGVDGHARDPGIPAGPGHADSDFATVGDEHLAQTHFEIPSPAHRTGANSDCHPFPIRTTLAPAPMPPIR
ncbi:hypothetical protein Srubr_61480 [Streptomyces rubradiris]|uniref:Uncharacterized protein n=1 Tax=Streptomyces rubradiris TaxID=285531 RepID=A0ABQ3RKB3_STRRR|nr:hypothetical protein GCM10018792_70530 [Streptomyces rubradiris]GHI56302.1 hypothetical protein Srubr_61480 [Streptomyces rubradiris]